MIALLRLLAVMALGAVAGGGLWWLCRGIFAAPVFGRRNYRNHQLPTAAGVVVALATSMVVALRAVGAELWRVISSPAALRGDALTADGATVAALVLGFAFLGLIDDLAGEGQGGGFRRHLRALAGGRLTTGALKLFGGPLVALAVLSQVSTLTDRLGLVRDAALICLAANLANLLDRAPGRTTKWSMVAFVALVATLGPTALGAPAATAGAALALLAVEMREEAMLGDTGANAIGAAMGAAVVVGADGSIRWLVLAALGALNLVSEFVSFSRVIDAVPVLRWFDRLGSPYRRS